VELIILLRQKEYELSQLKCQEDNCWICAKEEIICLKMASIPHRSALCAKSMLPEQGETPTELVREMMLDLRLWKVA